MSTELRDRLLRRIQRTGPITFADFMSDALYDPDDGFYERGRAAGPGAVGAEGAFVTSPHVSPVFGGLLAHQVEEFDAALGSPAPFTLVDAGAGDGTLAEQLVTGIGGDLRARLELALVERTGRHRALARGRRLPPASRVAADMGELAPGSVEGCIVANELLDNLPFHLVRGAEGGPAELYVGAGSDGTSLALVEGPVSSGDVNGLTGTVQPGRVLAVPTGAIAFLDAAATTLRRGYVLLIDYASAGDTGGTGGTGEAGGAEDFGGVHGYRGHDVVGDVLANPGSSDVTAGVDIEVVAAHARRLGLRTWGPVTQRDALAALGFADEVEALRREQVGSLDEGRGTEAVRAYSARGAAGLLVQRGGLGDFSVLCLGKDVDANPPRCMTRAQADEPR